MLFEQLIWSSEILNFLPKKFANRNVAFLCGYFNFYQLWYLTFGRIITSFEQLIWSSEVLNFLPKIPVNRNVAFCVTIFDFYLLWYLTFATFITIFEQLIWSSEILNCPIMKYSMCSVMNSS